MTFIFLLEKEFKQFFRDPGLPKMAIMFPVLMMLVFPFAVSMEIRNINLVVVDRCRSEVSSRLVNSCTASGYFRLVDVCDDPALAQDMMDRNEADAILTIEHDFDKQLENGTGTGTFIKVNTINGTKGSIGSSYLMSCISRFIAEYGGSSAGAASSGAASSGAASSGASAAGSASTKALDVSAKYYYNSHMDYKMFMVPALIVIAITMVTGFFPALNIVAEKERGTIEQINVTPVRKSTFILCKLIPYWCVAFFILAACLLVAWIVFGYTCRGSLWNVFLFTGLDIMVTAGLGLLISNYSDNAQQAMFVTWFFMMIFMLVSGIFTPISSMPDWAKAITYLNPLRYYSDAMRSVFIKGSSLADVWYDAVGLLAIGSAMVFWAIRSYRKTV